ncbi:MAG: Ribosomal protein L11 methyltransferase [Chlamydiia bacterium]|nr:Ribosomal protein L11 methyltransferase [Chlamydiia bacterium]MCH9618460.1 Ribosomal protein L11 methyltransferase [Chlamydiia bacterium]MCH9623922.1 Ribosomal protein L11 methyltransferase [Chlamydiia bacterium]
MEIDWEEIWRIHSPYYKNGRFELDLDNGECVLLHPGAAFGDGSHPTTNLVLGQLGTLVKGRTVVDLGSGSGVLSLASVRYGAKEVFAFEIDKASIESMEKSIALNNITSISINKRPQSFDIVLLNMISSEQEIALRSHPYLLAPGTIFLVSGILEEEKDNILQRFNPKHLIKEVVDKSWISLCFML